MTGQILLFDRIEFLSVKVEANEGEFSRNEIFPQLQVDAERLEILTKSDLIYPQDQIDDPCYFMLVYGVKISGDESTKPRLPYNFEVEAAGYFRYVGGNEFMGEDRFRAVRFSGYQILYGAIREMVSNLTARSRHGLWHLPARNFGRIAEKRAKEDESLRQAELAKRSSTFSAAEATNKQLVAKNSSGKTRQIKIKEVTSVPSDVSEAHNLPPASV